MIITISLRPEELRKDDYLKDKFTTPELVRYIRQEELARLVGARREVVSGLLNRLRASGHISYSPRGAITVRRASLERFLEARTRAC